MGDPPRAVYRRRRAGLMVLLLALVAAGAYVGVSLGHSSVRTTSAQATASRARASTSATGRSPAAPPTPPAPHLVVRAPGHVTGSWSVVAQVHGQPAAWIAERGGVTLMRFEQTLVHLTLHSGENDGGAGASVYGDRISSREIHLLIAGFNGGFKLSYKDVGFMSGGRVAAPLRFGLGSIVTYTDGRSDIGSWRQGVPSASKRVLSVLQNQYLLVDRGTPASSVEGCVIACWGETIGSATVVPRSGLGVTASGQLVWAAGEQLSPGGLARALVAGGAVRAIELDINPDWVAGYLYPHHPSGPVPAPVIPGQLGIAGKLLEPDARDFLAIIAD